jgi:Na+/phosphate symporter
MGVRFPPCLPIQNMVIKMLKEIEELIEQKVLERTNALNSKILKLTEELQLFNAMMEEILDLAEKNSLPPWA